MKRIECTDDCPICAGDDPAAGQDKERARLRLLSKLEFVDELVNCPFVACSGRLEQLLLEAATRLDPNWGARQ